MPSLVNANPSIVAPLEGALASAKWLRESRDATRAGFWGDGRASALFFAYLAVETADGKARATAEEIWRNLRRPKTTIEAAGTIYVASHLGALWGRSELIDRAEQLLPRIAEGIDRDGALDRSAGLAGVIPALLALHAVRSESLAWALALRCGDRLLELGLNTDEGLTWPELPSQRGFFHGPSGVAWALSLLGFPRFSEGALAAISRERVLTDDADSASPELALARLAMFREMPDLDFLNEARETLRVAMEMPPLDDYPSALELSYVAADAWPADSRWPLQRREWLARLLDEIREGKWEKLQKLSSAGVAGVGLSLLRAVSPRRVPSVVLSDPPYLPQANY